MRVFRRRFTTPGAAPGTVAPSRGDARTTIHTLCYDSEFFEEEDFEDAPQALSRRRAGCVLWVDVRGLGDGSRIKEIGELLELHPLAVSDVLNVGQRPKLDLYEGFSFIVLRMVTLAEDGTLQWEQVSLVLGDGLVVTFQETPSDCLEGLRQRIRRGRPTVRNSAMPETFETLMHAARRELVITTPYYVPNE